MTDGYDDGETTATHCSDSTLQSVNGIPAYQVVHGEYYPCNFGAGSNTNTGTGGAGSNTGYHICNSDGSWGTCTSNSTPLCESPLGSAHCHYIDYGAGFDTPGTGANQGDGSYAHPWKTFRCVGWWQSGAPSCNIAPGSDDYVYLKGTSGYTDSYTPDGGTSPNAALYLDSSRSGTSGHYLTFKRYPGSSSVITCPGSWSSGTDDSETGTKGFCVQNINASYVAWIDLEATGGWGSAFYLNPGNYNRVWRNYVHDKDGFANDNVAGINSAASVGVDVRLNRFIDIQDSHRAAAFNENIAAIVIFNDTTGGDHTVLYNRIGYTNAPDYVGNIKGWGIKFKHGANGVPAGGQTNGNVVRGNIVWNAQVGITCKTGSCYVDNNLVVNPLDYCFEMKAGDGSYDVQQDEKLRQNTCYGGHLLDIDMTEQAYSDTPVGPWDVEQNVDLDPIAFAGDTAGIEVDQYGSDAEYDTTMPLLTLKNNLLYNSNAAGYKWGFFAATSGSGGHGPAGNAGNNYTLVTDVQALNPRAGGAAWGLETGTSIENPALSSDGTFTPSSAHYVSQGWTNPVATPSPSPSPTPAPAFHYNALNRRGGKFTR